MEEMLEIDKCCGRKFRLNNTDYIRIGGVWFEWVVSNYTGEGQYKVIKDNFFKTLESKYNDLLASGKIS